MPDPHELRLSLLSSPLSNEFRSFSCPCYLYFSIGSIRSISRLSPRGDSRKKRNHGRAQPPADPSSVTRAIFTHARTGGTKRSNRGTVPWLTFEPFTFSRTLTCIYIYFFFSREMVEYFRSPRIVRRFFMYIYPRYSVAIILYALWIWIWIFKLRRSITRISYKIPINLSHHAYSHRVNS